MCLPAASGAPLPTASTKPTCSTEPAADLEVQCCGSDACRCGGRHWACFEPGGCTCCQQMSLSAKVLMVNYTVALLVLCACSPAPARLLMRGMT